MAGTSWKMSEMGPKWGIQIEIHTDIEVDVEAGRRYSHDSIRYAADQLRETVRDAVNKAVEKFAEEQSKRDAAPKPPMQLEAKPLAIE